MDNTLMDDTDQFTPDVLQRYLYARAVIDKELAFMLAFSNLLSQYQDCAWDEMFVNPYALGYFHQLLHGKVQTVMEQLDGFLPLDDARQVLADKGDGG